MIFFFVFVIIITVYENYCIVKNCTMDKRNKKYIFITYYIILILTVSSGIYYYLNVNGSSLFYNLFKFLNIHY